MAQLSPAALQHISNNQIGVNNANNFNVQTVQTLQPVINTVQQPDTFVNSQTPQKKKIDKKKVAIGVGIAFTAAAAIGAIIYGVKKGKIGGAKEAADDVVQDIKEEVTKELKDIKFDKGVASLKDNGEKFTGKISDVLKNGDKIILEYKDGVIQKSTGTGSKSFEKVYETVNGERLVHKTIDGKTETTNVTKIIKEAKELLKKAGNAAKTEAKKVVKEVEDEAGEEVRAAAKKVAYGSETLGDFEARIAQLRDPEGNFADIMQKIKPEKIESLKKLSPKVLKEVDNSTLVSLLRRNDTGEIVEVLNGISEETMEALQSVGITAKTIADGLSSGRITVPTAEGIIERFARRPVKPTQEQVALLLQEDMAKYQSQFKRVKLLDRIFTPGGIKGLKGEIIPTLKRWLGGDVSSQAFGDQADKELLEILHDALTPEAQSGGIDFIRQIAEKL